VKVNAFRSVPTPAGPTTLTLYTPAFDTAAVTPVIDVSLTTEKEVMLLPPMIAEVALVKFSPVIVTEVPPALGPLVGETDVTIGARMDWGEVHHTIIPSAAAVGRLVPVGPVTATTPTSTLSRSLEVQAAEVLGLVSLTNIHILRLVVPSRALAELPSKSEPPVRSRRAIVGNPVVPTL